MANERKVDLYIDQDASEWADKNCPIQFRNAIGYASLWGIASYPDVMISAVLQKRGDEKEIEIAASYQTEDKRARFYMAGIWHKEKNDFGFHS